MAFANITGLPFMPAGMSHRQGIPNLVGLSNSSALASTSAVIFFGELVWEDYGTHTVDTTGQSSMGWQCEGSTFSNAGTTAVIGLANVDQANGPPARAVNTAGIISFDVSKTMIGGGGGIAVGWNEHGPDAGTKTIASFEMIAWALQFTTRAGSDTVAVGMVDIINASASVNTYPGATLDFGGGSFSLLNRLPNVAITANDGTLGYIYGGYVATSHASQLWNSASAVKEYGNILEFPMPIRVWGIYSGIEFAGSSSNVDHVLYSAPLGTPVAERTKSINAHATQSSSQHVTQALFAPFDIAANTPFYVCAKPTTVNNVTLDYKTFDNSAHQSSETIGIGYAASRVAGPCLAQNAGKDRFCIGALISAFSDGVCPPSGAVPSSYGFA